MIEDKAFTRILELTNEKIRLDAKLKQDRNTYKAYNYSDRTKTRLAKKLIKTEQAIVHCENNLKLNQAMLDSYQ